MIRICAGLWWSLSSIPVVISEGVAGASSLHGLTGLPSGWGVARLLLVWGPQSIGGVGDLSEGGGGGSEGEDPAGDSDCGTGVNLLGGVVLTEEGVEGGGGDGGGEGDLT